ncbi:MAG: hypothetical protein HW416_3884 [Chloroflexi bacterium]|nr:hypothetical protein [Chloroflexota bacterium]
MDDNRDRMTPFRFDFDYLRNRYEYELQRKEQLTAQLTLPVAVLGLLGSAIVAMTRSFSYMDLLLTIPFAVLLGGASLAFTVCLVYLGRSYHRQTYVFLPLLEATEQSREEFLKFAPVMAGGEAEVLHEFEKQMRGRIINAADRNTVTNDERSALLHRARLALFAVLLMATVAGLPYVIDQVRF